MLSCKEVSRLTSKSMDTRLTWRERLGVRLHLFYCQGCQRFRDQVHFLRRAARRSTNALMAGTSSLPAATRERIRAALQSNR